jgi:hypothetical protein
MKRNLLHNFCKEFYIEFNENPTKGLVSDTKPQTNRQVDGQNYVFST